MRIALPQHHLSIEPSAEWIADEMEPSSIELHGLYFRSIEHGVYFNVSGQLPGDYPLTRDGLALRLRDQGWGSAPFDEWAQASGTLTIVGGTFETVGMGGEVVLEVFVTDGRFVADIVGPGERAVIAAVQSSVQNLASTVRFE